MGILAVGTVGYDDIKTPFGTKEMLLGGSGTYFSVSASFFNKVSLVAVVGDDFRQSDSDFLLSKGIDLGHLARLSGDSFRWKGEYGYDLNDARTIDTKLNVLTKFDPDLDGRDSSSDYLFLANIDPDLQMKVLSKAGSVKLTALDTMNFWIDNKRDSLIKAISQVDIVIINEAELRMLSETPNLVKGAKYIQELGPKTLVIKRGEYGALLVNEDEIFSAPAYPLEDVYDPTGAGDTFAGGFIGYISRIGALKLNDKILRQATIIGSVMASFTVEQFGVTRLAEIDEVKIYERFKLFRSLTHFEEIE